MGNGFEPTPNQAAAHVFLSELRTRISTQPLPYQYGVEARALESLQELFKHARDAMKNHPGCSEFARRTTTLLNVDIRPVTAKWHRAYSEGRLSSRDGANEFRADLAKTQSKLRDFASDLHAMAYGTPMRDELTPPPLDTSELTACLYDMPFGIPSNELIGKAVVDKFNEKEREAIDLRRRQYGLRSDGLNAVGLGLSGGGIRSATFCLGVCQVLAARNLLKDVDFLSTVSGGGYFGSFLTTRLDNKEAHSEVAAPHGPDSAAIRYLRRNVKYMAASNLKERWAMVTATLAGMILNWTAPLFLISLVALVATCIPIGFIHWQLLMFIAWATTLVCLLVYAYRMRYSQRSGGRLLGAASAATLALVFLWMLTRAYEWTRDFTVPLTWEATALISATITAAPAIIRFIPVLRSPSVRRGVLKVLLVLAGLIIPVGAIALSFRFYDLGARRLELSDPILSSLHDLDGRAVLATLVVLFGTVAIFLLNINLTGLHRLYRDHLARTFARPRDDQAQPIPLAAVNLSGCAPYHLINATVNLPSSTSAALRERRSDFFLFSKHMCGAPSIGYVATSEWSAGGAPIDLATAMAVSGAAASSYMGLRSMPTLSALLTFLNVRLGYWVQRPGRKALFASPGFSCLVREMFGIGMSERNTWINLSDGGHIENMGVYELIRRRCKFIISVDGEADPASTFHGHLTLVRHVQIDFGVQIEADLTDLRPDVSSQFSQSHAMMCRIHYPATDSSPAGIGLILYMKLSMTGNEAELIRRYRALNPEFPHQTTLDQFFDEEQFEAYRQLGVHVAEGLFSPAILPSNASPASVRDWFGGLAGNMLTSRG